MKSIEILPNNADEQDIIDMLSFWKDMIYSAFCVPQYGPSPLYRVLDLYLTIKILEKYRMLWQTAKDKDEQQKIIENLHKELGEISK